MTADAGRIPLTLRRITTRSCHREHPCASPTTRVPATRTTKRRSHAPAPDPPAAARPDPVPWNHRRHDQPRPDRTRLRRAFRRHPAQRLGAGRRVARAGHRHHLRRGGDAGRGRQHGHASEQRADGQGRVGHQGRRHRRQGRADQRHQPEPAVSLRRERSPEDHRLPGQQHREHQGPRHRQAGQGAGCAGRRGRQPDQWPQLRDRQPGAGVRRSPPRRIEESPVACRNLCQVAGAESAPDRQHFRGQRRFPPGPDDGHGQDGSA